MPNTYGSKRTVLRCIMSRPKQPEKAHSFELLRQGERTPQNVCCQAHRGINSEAVYAAKGA